jgi:endonuclease YncB( thermonuclease family)
MPPAVGIAVAADRIDLNRRRIQWHSFLLIVCVLWISGSELGKPTFADTPVSYTVLRVYDGDTILVSGSGERKVIRLLGIDAPETSKAKGEPGQPYSKKARRHLSDLILNRDVTLLAYGEDRYHRTLAVVYWNARDINHAMIQAGFAEVYQGRTPNGFDKAPYLKTEAEARQNRIGMWRQGKDYVSPIRWKHPR